MATKGSGMTIVNRYDNLVIEPVMPGLVPGIHVFLSFERQDVDGRNKSGHDERGR
jgi:hypothetical protein